MKTKTQQIILIIFCFYFTINVKAEYKPYRFSEKVDSLIILQSQLNNDTNKVKLLNEISWHLVVINADSSISYGKAALNLASSLNWEKGKGEAYNNIGESLRFKGLVENSITNHKKALEIFQSINDQRGIAHSLSQIGISYFNSSNLSISYQYFYKALSINRTLNDKDGIAKNLSYMGIIQSNLKEYQLALEHFNYSKKVYEEQNDSHNYAIQLGNIGLVYYELKDYAKALENYEEALKIFEEVGDIYSKSIFLGNSGLVFTAFSEYEKAYSRFNESLNLSIQLNDKEGIGLQTGNIGRLYLKQAEDKIHKQFNRNQNFLLAKAISYLERSNALLLSIGENIERKEYLYSLSKAYKLLDNDEKAFEVYLKAAELKDSILTSESKKQIAELEIQQQLDLREKELDYITSKNDFNKIINYFVFGLMFLITGSAIVIFILYSRLKKHNKSLNENIKLREEVETSLKRNEAELKKYQEHLEDLVNERTIKLANEINERIEIENNLKRSEEIIRNLFETMPTGFYRSTPEGKYIDANPAYIKLLGYDTLEELKSLYIPEDVYVSPEEREELTKSNPDYIEREETFRLKRKDGSIIWLEEFSRFVKDENGKVIFNEGLCKDITDKKIAEEKLKESEEQKSKILSSTLSGLYIYDVQINKYIYINPAHTKFTGWSITDLNKMGERFFDLFHPEDFPKVLNHFQSIIEGKKEDTFTIEYRFRTKSEEWIWLLSYDQAFERDEFGNTKKIIGSFIDISKQKEIEVALRESEELFRKLVMTVPDLIVRTNLNGDIIFVNEITFENLKFVKKEDLLGKNILSFVAEKDLPRAIENTKLMFEKPLGVVEYLLQFEDKYQFDCEVNGDVIFDAENKPVEMVYIIRDITERKKAEIALKESEERFSRAFKTSPAPHVISEIETGKFIDVNEQWIRMLGYSYEENIGRTSKDLKIWEHPSDRDKAINILKNEGYFKDYPVKFINKSGEKRDALWSAEKITYGGKEVMLSMIYDFTEQKNIHEALIESQRLSAVGEMSSAIAHDFNNSLQSISGNVELALIRAEQNKSVEKYLNTIKNSVNDAAVRVQLLQRFAGKSKSKNEHTLVDLNRIAEDVIYQTRPLWKDKVQKEGIVINFETKFSQIPKLLGNEGELRSALYNLVKNGIEAMPQGGEIRIETWSSGKNIYLKCSDTGIGMDDETKSRVFQPFFSTKGFESGRGMGMVNAYSIIKEHNGKIEILRSEPGKGTEIQIILPASSHNEKTENDDVKPVNEKKSVKLLWVDDDPQIREVAKEMLEVLGCEGEIIGSGEDALTKLNKGNYDLVITDIGMPNMNGWELADKIRENYSSKIKIAVLTGWGDLIDEKERESHGVSFVLGKPFTLVQVEKLIDEIIE
ncbi:MAG: PAS domain S-box protein [Melioribacteraceae bacterium]|nr:PAS domain S-box protein [Melioribacteraceae bacterium]